MISVVDYCSSRYVVHTLRLPDSRSFLYVPRSSFRLPTLRCCYSRTFLHTFHVASLYFHLYHLHCTRIPLRRSHTPSFTSRFTRLRIPPAAHTAYCRAVAVFTFFGPTTYTFSSVLTYTRTLRARPHTYGSYWILPVTFCPIAPTLSLRYVYGLHTAPVTAGFTFRRTFIVPFPCLTATRTTPPSLADPRGSPAVHLPPPHTTALHRTDSTFAHAVRHAHLFHHTALYSSHRCPLSRFRVLYLIYCLLRSGCCTHCRFTVCGLPTPFLRLFGYV